MHLGDLSTKDTGETCGVWRRPESEWKPDVQFFRCKGCGAVVPESMFRVSSPELLLCNYCLAHATHVNS